MKAKIKNNQIRLIFWLFLATTVFGLAFFSSIKANDIDCGQLTGDDKKKCEILEKKAEDYQDLIDINNKQQSTLQKQMEIIDLEQVKTQKELSTTKSRAEELAIKINSLEGDIKYKENLMNYQKLILAGMMQSYYEYYQQGILDLVLINRNFSAILNQSDYLEQTSLKINEILESIEKIKTELEKQQGDLVDKKEENEKTKQELERKKSELLTNEAQKQNLLIKTQGEEAKYHQLLSRVEAQKRELFNFSEASNLAEVDASVGNYAKPDSKYWASTDWYFSQKDSRWGNKTIGNSNSLMKDYGCAVTSVSMTFRFAGASIDPGKMSKQKIFYYDLIKWPASWNPDIELTSSINHGNINWKTIDKEIANQHPVIVFIKKTNGRGGHYVVIHNKNSKDYIVHDPYFGSNLYLGTSRALVGALGLNSGTKIDQMIIYH
jgi:peptidoglycan hydrolase CwlO-like protein